MRTKHETETLRIKLSERRPVTIQTNDWKLIADAADFDGEFEGSAQRVSRVFVREHADGRVIVYGTFETRHTDERDSAAGWILEDPTDATLQLHIRRVCGIIGDDILAGECIQDLPEEDLS